MSGNSRGLIALQQLVDTQLKSHGFSRPVVVDLAIVDNAPSLYVNYTDGTLSATDAAVQIRLISSNSAYPQLATRSHYAGQSVAGPYSALVVAFAPAQDGSTPLLAKLTFAVVAALELNGVPVDLRQSDPAAAAPALKGLNGATADANIPAVGLILQSYPFSSQGG